MTRTLMTMLAVVTGALVLVASGLGRSNAVPALRGTVGPGFTINLTKRGKKVKNLKGGTYRFAISDRSAAHNFVLERERGVEKRLTTVAFSGTKTVTLKLTRGSWKFYCEPHQSMMFGRFTVRGATTAAAAAARSDDRGGHGEVEPGDDKGGHGEPEPGDDRGGR